MRKTIIGLKTTLALAAVACAAIGQAQVWEEHFTHNNAALYTNLNGGPDNLTIEKGIAKFSGVEGTYYGRMDLPIPTVEPRFASLGGYLYPQGALGVGWYSPKQNAGVSALFVVETLTVSLFEHHGFSAPVLLASGPYDPGLFYWMYYSDDPILGESYLRAGPPGSLYTETTVRWSEDMHFFMYGWSSPSGPGRLDNVVCYSVPEPTAFVALALGVGYLAVRRRSIIES